MISAWDSEIFPDKVRIRSEIYDRLDGLANHEIKILVICAAPRSASSNLSRLLLAAGIGMPTEYFNVNTVQVLTQRWKINSAEYAHALVKRRHHNGIFSVNIQFNQMAEFGSQIEFLLKNATVVHLERMDITGQVISFAAARLAENWSSSGEDLATHFSDEQYEAALKEAIRSLSKEFEGLKLLKLKHPGVLNITSEEMNFNSIAVINRIAALMEIGPDQETLDKMQRLVGKYKNQAKIKKALLEKLQDSTSLQKFAADHAIIIDTK
jgi:LPS sulfotransferase NodH